MPIRVKTMPTMKDEEIAKLEEELKKLRSVMVDCADRLEESLVIDGGVVIRLVINQLRKSAKKK